MNDKKQVKKPEEAKNEEHEVVVPAAEPVVSKPVQKPAVAAKPKIVSLFRDPNGHIFVATETTIYQKKGEGLEPVKWQVPE